MQILKGNVLKSNTIGILAANTNSYIVIYDDNPFYIEDSYIISPKECDLPEVVDKFINPEMKMVRDSEKRYDYLIIYTNLDENDQNFKSAYEKLSKYSYPCREILMTCK